MNERNAIFHEEIQELKKDFSAAQEQRRNETKHAFADQICVSRSLIFQSAILQTNVE